MKLSFKKFFQESEDDPVARWQAMRQQTQGLGDTGKSRPKNYSELGISDIAWDLMSKGWQMGTVVPDNIVKFLGLNGKNYSLVSDSILYTGSRAYPFVREKKAGKPTGRIFFVKGYNPNDFLIAYSDLKI